MPSTAKTGDKVIVHFTGKLSHGDIFDSSREKEPVEFVLGDRAVIAGLNRAIQGMSPGEQKVTKITPDEAYGPRRQDLVVDFPRERIPENIAPVVGQQLNLKTSDGRSMPAVVVDANDAGVTLDANHPLAGQELTFEIELVDVVKAR